jgi:hypothetical protein
MRLPIGLLTVLCIGALSAAWATEPEPKTAASGATPTSTSSSEASTPAPSAETPAPATSPTAASTAQNAAPAAKSDKPELTHDEKLLVANGYKLEMRNGEKWFCKREQVLGSRLNATKRCGTAAMLQEVTRLGQDEIRQNQRNIGLNGK